MKGYDYYTVTLNADGQKGKLNYSEVICGAPTPGRVGFILRQEKKKEQEILIANIEQVFRDDRLHQDRVGRRQASLIRMRGLLNKAKGMTPQH
jgi:hypothetical protein